MSSRAYLTLCIILGTLAILLVLQWLIPAVQLSPGEWMQVAYLLGFLALIGGGVLSRRQMSVSSMLTYGGIWAIIILLLMIGYQLWGRQNF